MFSDIGSDIGLRMLLNPISENIFLDLGVYGRRDGEALRENGLPVCI